MRLGIYTGGKQPGVGGANTLIETIRKDTASSTCLHEKIAFFDDEGAAPEILDGGVRYVNITEKISRSLTARLKRKALKLVRKPLRPKQLDDYLKREKIDLLWISVPFRLDISVPYIFTVWDLGHRMTPFFPEVSTVGWTWEAREATYQKMLYRASYVVTGNDEGKREILANYPMNAEKIKVVPFPVPESCNRQLVLPESVPGIVEPFIFYPAQFWAHKNHVILVKALNYLRAEKHININCYFVGTDQGNQDFIQRQIADCRLGDQIKILGFVDEVTLRFLYKKAFAMTFVSLLGPNNLPPLEAAALGCPIILSDLPGHREQMQDAALYVNAKDSRAVGDAIGAILGDSRLRDELIAKGTELTKRLGEKSYFARILEIVDEFAPLRNCWG